MKKLERNQLKELFGGKRPLEEPGCSVGNNCIIAFSGYVLSGTCVASPTYSCKCVGNLDGEPMYSIGNNGCSVG